MIKHFILSLTLLFSTFLSLHSQVLEGPFAQQVVSDADKIRIKPNLLVPNYIHFQAGSEKPASQFNNYFKEQFLQGNSAYSLSLINENDDQLGHIHKRYRQIFDGKEVEGSMLITHASAGKIYAINGDYFDLEGVQKEASIAENKALENAMAYIQAEQYMWEKNPRTQMSFGRGIWDAIAEQNHDSYFPVGELVYVPKDGDYQQADFRLAWKFDIQTLKPFGQTLTFVDAIEGEVICQFDQIHTADTMGVAVTRYSGNRPITTDFVSPGLFRLREAGRGNGIVTLDNRHGNGPFEFEDADNVWNNANGSQDEVAGDVHWATEMTYDYYLQKHGRNSLDDNGYRITSNVHFGPSIFQNAFWNGRANYGDGDSTRNISPLTSIDICAHEISHGLTNFTADLIYQNESGALNESFSDIFGNAIEQFARPEKFSWQIAEDTGSPFRNMANPLQFNNPRNYFGTQWHTAAWDNGGVHINSGVQNHWFYLLVEGGAGTNDFGDAYTISSIGMDTAASVAFRNLTVYLTPSSQYADARFYAIQSAIDLYGICGRVHQQVTNAWHAVGVGTPYSPNPITAFKSSITEICTFPYTIDFIDESKGVSSYFWDFGDGNTSNMANPSHTYASPGFYSVSLKINGICGGSDSLLKSNLIQVIQSPPAPTANMPAPVACQGQGILVADPGSNDEIRWFDGSGNLLSVGDTFLTPFQGQNNTFYARSFDLKPRQQVGLLDSAAGTGGYITTDLRSLVFDVDRKVNLKSVKVYAENASQRLIEYRNTNGVVLATRSVFVPAGESRIELNIPLELGADQQLGLLGTVDLFANNSNLNYPYEIPGVISIKGTTDANAQALYIWFYDWIVHEDDCAGEATPVTLEVDTIGLPSVMNVERCGPGQANFVPTSFDSSLNWYDMNGFLLASGALFQTPYITSTTDFQVENVRFPDPIKFGPANASFGRSSYINNIFDSHLTFKVLQPMRLKSVWLDAKTAGLRKIILSDAQGVAIDTIEVQLNAGPQRVNLDLELQAGDYRLGGFSLDLKVTDTNVAFPYSLAGLVEINGSSEGFADYYYFYDWEVQNTACVSTWTTITAAVNAGPSASFDFMQNKSTLQFTDELLGTMPTSWMWDFGDGNTSNMQNPTHTYLAKGTYTVTLTTMDGSCTNSWTETIVIDHVTSINSDINGNAFQLFPNPGDGNFWLSREETNTEVEVTIWNNLGQKIQSKTIPRGTAKIEINMNEFARGTYFVRIKEGDKIWVKKYLIAY